jgi:hypothetical protein
MADHPHTRVLVNSAYLLLVYYCLVSHNPSLLVGDIGKALACALFVCLLLFALAGHSAQIRRVVVSLLRSLRLPLFALLIEPDSVEWPLAVRAIPNSPTQFPLFQRPPPIRCL